MSDIKTILYDNEEKFLECLGKIRGYSMPPIKFRNQDRYRLLTLKAWSWHYKIPLLEVIQVLISYWDTRTKGWYRRGVRKTIGVRVPTLTGTVSSTVLEEYVARTYPNGENVSAWKEERRRELLYLDDIPEPLPSHPDLLVKEYRSQVERARDKREKSKKEGSRYIRRVYRDNPWY